MLKALWNATAIVMTIPVLNPISRYIMPDGEVLFGNAIYDELLGLAQQRYTQLDAIILSDSFLAGKNENEFFAFLEFPDYTREELGEIAYEFLRKKGYVIADDALEKMMKKTQAIRLPFLMLKIISQMKKSVYVIPPMKHAKLALCKYKI